MRKLKEPNIFDELYCSALKAALKEGSPVSPEKAQYAAQLNAAISDFLGRSDEEDAHEGE